MWKHSFPRIIIFLVDSESSIYLRDRNHYRKDPACLTLMLLAGRDIAKADDADSLPKSSYYGRPANLENL